MFAQQLEFNPRVQEAFAAREIFFEEIMIATGVNLMRKEYGLGELSVEVVTDFIGNGAGKLVERSLNEIASADSDAFWLRP